MASSPITYKVRDGGTTHAPMVTARVGGIEGRLVLDTGSEVHLLNEELVDELELPKEPGEEGPTRNNPGVRRRPKPPGVLVRTRKVADQIPRG